MGFKRILIANRGEIALRILRSCRELGIEAAIIHGREDRTSLPVQLSDYAIPIYRKEPLSSYLEIDAVINAAKRLKVDAVHPGYGFLAENSWFVSRLEQENITFIGPNSEVISLKEESKFSTNFTICLISFFQSLTLTFLNSVLLKL